MLLCQYPQYRQEVAKAKEMGREKGTRYMFQIYMKGYLRLVASLDENIGRLLDHLDQSGLSDNTIVIYTSDNGFFNGEHGFFNKMWMYEPSLHLPLLVRWPGRVKPGSVNDDLLSMIDSKVHHARQQWLNPACSWAMLTVLFLFSAIYQDYDIIGWDSEKKETLFFYRRQAGI